MRDAYTDAHASLGGPFCLPNGVLRPEILKSFRSIFGHRPPVLVTAAPGQFCGRAGSAGGAPRCVRLGAALGWGQDGQERAARHIAPVGHLPAPAVAPKAQGAGLRPGPRAAGPVRTALTFGGTACRCCPTCLAARPSSSCAQMTWGSRHYSSDSSACPLRSEMHRSPAASTPATAR